MSYGKLELFWQRSRERQTFLLAHRRWRTFRETSLSGDEREETSAVRRLLTCDAPTYTMASNEGAVKAIVSFYRDDSDTVFLIRCTFQRDGINFDWLNGPRGNVGLCVTKTFAWRRVKQWLEECRALKMLSKQLIKIKILLYQFSNLMFNSHHIWLFS